MAALDGYREDPPTELSGTTGRVGQELDRGRRRSIMLHYAVIFFVVAIIAAIFGFSV